MRIIIFKGENTIQHYAFPKFSALYNLSKVHLFLIILIMVFTITGAKAFLGSGEAGYSPKGKAVLLLIFLHHFIP